MIGSTSSRGDYKQDPRQLIVHSLASVSERNWFISPIRPGGFLIEWLWCFSLRPACASLAILGRGHACSAARADMDRTVGR